MHIESDRPLGSEKTNEHLLSRRAFIACCAKFMAGVALFLNGCASLLQKDISLKKELPNVACDASAGGVDTYEYIVCPVT